MSGVLFYIIFQTEKAEGRRALVRLPGKKRGEI